MLYFCKELLAFAVTGCGTKKNGYPSSFFGVNERHFADWKPVIHCEGHNSPLRMHYWRGQSLKLHIQTWLFRVWRSPAELAITRPSPAVWLNEYQTKLVLSHLCCLADCKSSWRICWIYVRGLLHNVSFFFPHLALFFFGIRSFSSIAHNASFAWEK